MDRNPETSASAVPATPSPPTSPAATPIVRNRAAISLKPHPSRNTPTTSATNAASTRPSTTARRPSSEPDTEPDALIGAERPRAA